jgi:GNAT superfamily N-acetyltransferase
MADQRALLRPIKLILMNLHSESEFAELVQQRIICGWDSSHSDIEGHRSAMDQKLKSLFWITVDFDPTRLGHVSLDSYANPADPDLVRADKSILTIQTFFIMPSHRSIGLGGRVMDLIEEMATKEPYGSPKCEMVTINTLSKAALERNLPMWIEKWKREETERPHWSMWSKEDWYAKRGYVKWKEEVRYDNLEAAFMRKRLR